LKSGVIAHWPEAGNSRPGADRSGPRILIVKMWALGDILMATPLLSALKRQYPCCVVSWLVDREYAAVLRDNPLIDDLIPFESGKWRKLFRYGNLPAYLKMSLELRKSLLDRRFDLVINLTAEKWWSVWFGVAPKRIGLFPRQRPGLMGRVYTEAIPRFREPWLHNTRHYLLPAKALGIPEPYDERMVVGVCERRLETVREFLSGRPEFRPDRPTIVMHPGTSQASKCWFPDNYARLADSLRDFNIAITGSPGERDLAEGIAAQCDRPVVVAAGELPELVDTIALVSEAAAVVTGDTSVLHIASALDVPLVGIYGSTRPRDNAPLFGRSVLLHDDSVACAPCYKAHCPLPNDRNMACMRGVSVDTVLRALAELGT
jgi:heptosyltransferase-1